MVLIVTSVHEVLSQLFTIILQDRVIPVHPEGNNGIVAVASNALYGYGTEIGLNVLDNANQFTQGMTSTLGPITRYQTPFLSFVAS